MGKTLKQVIAGLSTEKRTAVDQRAAALIAEERERLRADVYAGLRQLDEGKTSPFDAAAVERIKRRSRQKLAEIKSDLEN
jgi:hypothetical protein